MEGDQIYIGSRDMMWRWSVHNSFLRLQPTAKNNYSRIERAHKARLETYKEEGQMLKFEECY
jgi:hypothetical protein